MTKEQLKISKENRKKTRQLLCVPDGYDMHHKDPSWKENDVERYIQWNPEDLIILSHGEHTKLHWKGAHHSDETKLKISQSKKGQGLGIKNPKKGCKGEKNGMYGKHMPEEAKQKLREKALERHLKTKGSTNMHWYNNGTECILTYECPDGFVPGRIKRGN